MPDSLSHQEDAIQKHSKKPLHTHDNGYDQIDVDEDVRKLKLSCTVGENENAGIILGNSLEVPQNVKQS